MNSAGLSAQRHPSASAELGESFRSRSSLSVVRRALAHDAALPQPHFVHSVELVFVAAVPQVVDQEDAYSWQRRETLRAPTFSTRCGGTIASAVNGLPSQWTWIAPSEISVFPVPHSATTIAGPRQPPAFGHSHDGDGLCRERASAAVQLIRGEAGSSEWVECGILLKNALAQIGLAWARMYVVDCAVMLSVFHGSPSFPEPLPKDSMAT